MGSAVTKGGKMIFTVVLWAIWMTIFNASENKQLAPPTIPDKRYYETYEECERQKEEFIKFGVTAKLLRRIGNDIVEWLPYAEMPDIKLMTLLECKEMRAITDK